METQAPADLLLHSPVDEVPILKVILSSEVVARALNITYMVQGKNKRKRRNGHKRHILPVSFLLNSCHESQTEEGLKMCILGLKAKKEKRKLLIGVVIKGIIGSL